MLKLPLYQDLSSLWSSMSKLDGKFLIVCPSPAIADATRKRVPDSMNVVTMANFSQDLAKSLNIDLEKFRRKSELLFHLSFYAHEAFNIGFQEFLTAFNVFTELRGVSSNIVVIETVLDEYLPKIKEWVLAFYEYINLTGWIDEHGLYESISNGLDHQKSKINDSIIFYGFNHLTGSQVDFIKKLASDLDIYLPYRKSIYENSWPTDWISWFANNSEAFDIEPVKPLLNESHVYEFTENDLAQKLKLALIKSPGADILFAKKGLEAKDIISIPHNDLSFKIGYDFFDLELERIFTSYSSSYDQASFVIYKIKKEVEELEFQSPSDFKKLKVLSLLAEKLSIFPDEHTVGVFEWGVLEEVLKLDLPRLNLTSFFSEQSDQYRLMSLSDIDDPDISENSVLILSSASSPFKGATELFSEEVEKHISSISPMRRTSLEDEILIEHLKELIFEKKLKVFVEKSIEDKEPKWLELIQDLGDIEEFIVARESGKHQLQLAGEKRDDLKNSEYFSATRLQTHLDCHLFYYYKYVDPVFPNFSFETEMEPRELGSLEHEIIAKYCEQFQEIDDSQIREISQQVLDEYLIKENKRLDEFRKLSFLENMIQYAQVGIQACLDIQKSMGLKSMPLFERRIKEEFPKLNRSGAIDFSYFENKELVLVDFKRGAGGIPSWTEISEYLKIQFLFYLNLAKERVNVRELNHYFMGYLCLSDIEKSMLWVSDDLKADLMEKGYPSVIFKKYDIIEAFAEYPQWEKDYIDKIQKQSRFLPTPRKKEVCRYCELKNICSRGVSL